jgi:hypothetical protein
VAACRGKLPLQQSTDNQHKAKTEPGKSFFNSEPHRQVKFLEKTKPDFQIRVKFKSSLSQLSPGEMPMPNGRCPFVRFLRESIAY